MKWKKVLAFAVATALFVSINNLHLQATENTEPNEPSAEKLVFVNNSCDISENENILKATWEKANDVVSLTLEPQDGAVLSKMKFKTLVSFLAYTNGEAESIDIPKFSEGLDSEGNFNVYFLNAYSNGSPKASLKDVDEASDDYIYSNQDLFYYVQKDQKMQPHFINQVDESQAVSTFNKLKINVADGKNVILPEDCDSLFAYFPSRITIDLSKFDASHATSMRAMFYSASLTLKDDQNDEAAPIKLDTSKVTDMSYMFANSALHTSSFQLDTSNVDNMAHMFERATIKMAGKEGVIKLSDTSKVRNMYRMLALAEGFAVDATTWDTSNVKTMSGMFSQCKAGFHTRDKQPLDTSNVLDMSSMFEQFPIHHDLPFDVSSMNTQNAINMSGMFAHAYSNKLGYQGLKNGMEYMNETTPIDLSNWDVSKVVSMKRMFAGSTLKPLMSNGDKKWDTSNVEDISHMFESWGIMSKDNKDIENLKQQNTLDVSMLNTSKVKDMSNTFSDTYYVKPDVSNWDTGNVINMSAMFSNTHDANPDVSKWDTSKVQSMEQIFDRAHGSNPNVSKWDTGNVINMSGMFWNAENANPNVSEWNTSNVQDMSQMFSGASSANPDISKWSFKSIRKVERMLVNTSQDIIDLRSMNVDATQIMAYENSGWGARGYIFDVDYFKANKEQLLKVMDFKNCTIVQGYYFDDGKNDDIKIDFYDKDWKGEPGQKGVRKKSRYILVAKVDDKDICKYGNSGRTKDCVIEDKIAHPVEPISYTFTTQVKSVITVTFVADKGSPGRQTFTITPGQIIDKKLVKTPVRTDGYEFDGWYYHRKDESKLGPRTAEDDLLPFDFSRKIYGDIDVVTKWKEVKIPVPNTSDGK